jgi:hypothetical protein
MILPKLIVETDNLNEVTNLLQDTQELIKKLKANLEKLDNIEVQIKIERGDNNAKDTTVSGEGQAGQD